MPPAEFALRAHVDAPLAVAEARLREALKAEGFGVLTEIDVRKTLKEKLDADFRAYKILGACNPLLAQRALAADERIGVILPCNVVVTDDGRGGADVLAFDPRALLAFSDAPTLRELAADALARLQRALASL